MEIDHAKLAKVGLEGFALLDQCFGREYRPANHAKLAKVGREGFALVDQCFGREYRPAHQPGYQANEASAALRKDKKQLCEDIEFPAVYATKDRVIDSYKAPQMYKKKPICKAF